MAIRRLELKYLIVVLLFVAAAIFAVAWDLNHLNTDFKSVHVAEICAGGRILQGHDHHCKIRRKDCHSHRPKNFNDNDNHPLDHEG